MTLWFLTSVLPKTQITLQLTSYYSFHLTLCGLDVLAVVLEARAALAVRRSRRRSSKGTQPGSLVQKALSLLFPLNLLCSPVLLPVDVPLQNSLPLVQPQVQLSPNKGVLDYLESEIQNLNMSQLRPPSHQRQAVQPSLLSSLGSEIMPPPLTDHISSIHGSSNSSRPQRAARNSRPWDSAAEDRRENRRLALPSSEDSHSSYSREPWDRQREDHPQRQRTGGYNGRPQHSRRDVSPPRQADRGKSSSSSCSFYPEEAKERFSHHRGWRQEPARRRDYQHHTRRSNNSGQRRHSYSPPSRRGSWSSSEEQVRLPATNRRRRHQSREWPEDKPPSYRSLEVIPGQEKKHKGSAGPRSVSQLPFCFPI